MITLAIKETLSKTIGAMAACIWPFIDCSIQDRPDGTLVITLDYAPPERASVRFNDRLRVTDYTNGSVFRNVYQLTHDDISRLCHENTSYHAERIGRRVIVECVDIALGRVNR